MAAQPTTSTPDLHVPDAPGPLRHRGQPVRRPRRRHQHHAADPAGPGRRGDPPRPQPLASHEVVDAAIAGGRAGRRASAPTRAATSSTSGTSSTCCASAAPGTSGSTAAAAASSSPSEIERLREPGVTDLLARGRPAARPRPAWSTPWSPSLRRRPVAPQPPTVDGGRSPASGRRWPGRSPRSRPGSSPTTLRAELRSGRRRPARSRCSASPAPAARASRSLTDELVRRLPARPGGQAARSPCVAVDPTRRRGGGALLGDRIRMNALDGDRVFFRSLATRGAAPRCPRHLPRRDRRLQGRRATTWSIVETPGIGQGDAAIVAARRRLALRHDARVRRRLAAREDRHARLRRRRRDQQVRAPRRRRTPCATSRRQLVRNREAFGTRPGGHAGLRHQSPRGSTTTASPRSTSTCADLLGRARPAGRPTGALPPVAGRTLVRPAPRSSRRSGCATSPRSPRPCAATTRDTGRARPTPPAGVQQLDRASRVRARRRDRTPTAPSVDALLDPTRRGRPAADGRRPARRLARGGRGLLRRRAGLHGPRPGDPHAADAGVAVRQPDPPGRAARATPTTASCCASCARENLPGRFPFTAGVFPFKRDDEDPARMFAGEGDPFRTNRRFHLLSEGQPATRLSTAFDSVTLYGRDPDERPDIYGKVGTSGVSRRHARRHEGALRRLRPRRARPRRSR